MMIFSKTSDPNIKLQVFILTLICITTVICKDKTLRGNLSDLSTDTVMFDKDALQANISWNSINIGDRKFDVSLRPQTDEYCTNKKPCVSYGLSSNTTHVLLPVNPMIELEHHECTVMLGCTYDVFVQTTDGMFRQNVTYTVPDCIDDVCSCKHAEILPSAFLNATMDKQMFTIFWKITPPTSNWTSDNVSLESIFISVGIQNNPFLRWGGQNRNLQEIQIPLQNSTEFFDNDEGFHLVNLTEVMTNSSEFRLLVRAHIVDSKGCFGRESNFTYRVVPKKTTVIYPNNMFVKTFLMCFLVVIILLIVGFAFTYRHMQHLLLTKSFVKNWRGIYQNVPSVGFRPIKFQENFLYGEEIEHCEIPHSSLKLSHNIGKGAFGSVYLAVADGIGPKECSGLVAVKKLKKDHNVEEMDEFLCEIALMKTISRHPNVVALIGYCTVKQPMLIVMEYVGCGDLLNYLRKLREQHELRTAAANRMAHQQRVTMASVSDSRGSSTLNLMSQNSSSNKCGKSYSNLSKNGYSNHTSAASLNNPITITTLNKLEMEVNYLELCHSSTSTSDASSYVTKPESIASTKRASDGDNYTVFPNPAAVSLECVLDHKELHSFAIQIARGMQHLENKGIIHRDLAARNILIDENRQLKISDFGLSRSIIYVTRRAKKVPIRWMAIEALRENIYTSKSDIWSFAVVLWEIGTLGGIPYPHVCNELLLRHLIDGHRLQRPEICSEQLYKLMRLCWSECPMDRPSFTEIVQKLEFSENNAHIYVNFDDIAPNYVFPPTATEATTDKHFKETTS